MLVPQAKTPVEASGPAAPDGDVGRNRSRADGEQGTRWRVIFGTKITPRKLRTYVIFRGQDQDDFGGELDNPF